MYWLPFQEIQLMTFSMVYNKTGQKSYTHTLTLWQRVFHGQVPLTFSVKIKFSWVFYYQIVDCPLCRAHFVCLCTRLQSNNFLLAFRPLLLQAYINRPLLHSPSPADYRSDYCYFCAYSLLSQLPQRDLIISGMARFKLYLYNSHHYHNVTSLPKQFSPVSPLREEKEALFQ